jgi:hypothetical protein
LGEAPHELSHLRERRRVARQRSLPEQFLECGPELRIDEVEAFLRRFHSAGMPIG